MRILLSGGTGFLGKHVLPLLKQQPDYQISAPSSRGLDLLDRGALSLYMRAFKPDVIVHMAALCGGILANKNSPADFLHKNLDMASNLFHAAKEANCTRIYTLGSVCAYPKFCPAPFQEDNLWNGYPEETNAPYGMAKRVILMLGQTYRQQYGFTGAHLIPVNMYGEYDNFDLTNSHVIPALIRKFEHAVSNNVTYVECWGTGEATREFLYAGDTAQAIQKAIEMNLDTSLPINLGTGQDIPIKDLSELIAKLVGFKGKIVFTGEVSNGQPKRMLDVSRAQQILGWKADTNFEDGLQKTIKWYKENKSSIISLQE